MYSFYILVIGALIHVVSCFFQEIKNNNFNINFKCLKLMTATILLMVAIFLKSINL